MNIGQAAEQSGVSAKMVRHYESLGLLPKVARTEAGYRQYGTAEVHTLRFIRRGRELGFSIAEIAELLKLWQNRRRASADVKRIALSHVADLDRRIAEMSSMRRTLETLAHCCQGNDRPDCPILDELADADPPPKGAAGFRELTPHQHVAAAFARGRRAPAKGSQPP
jgi:MerR family transcriptional regulator, copper efflux regulator